MTDIGYFVRNILLGLRIITFDLGITLRCVLTLSCSQVCNLLNVRQNEEEHIRSVTPRENSPCISINDVKG